ncbi:hypothetical protein [uncultured Victivallis sp.]|uniref:hypothetical protein n=1 Tax=uncultured Victivallis sp. TaxID=354118 RepID=UPI0025F58A55|nr:hypothetical protein [uncultured Victivallis sp.]
MQTQLVKSSGGVGFRLLLFLLAFTLPLIAYVINHVNSGCFVSIDLPEHHICREHTSRPGETQDAELQENEFDEAVIPKAFHDFIPDLDIPQFFRFGPAAFRPIVCTSHFPRRSAGPAFRLFQILRC